MERLAVQERAVRTDLERPHPAAARLARRQQGLVGRQRQSARRETLAHDPRRTRRAFVPDAPVTRSLHQSSRARHDELIGIDAVGDDRFVPRGGVGDDSPTAALARVEPAVGPNAIVRASASSLNTLVVPVA